MIKIALWKKDSGNMMSHGKGLTAEQVAMLQTLKEGDRLIAFSNKKTSPAAPDYNLTIVEKKEVPNELE